MSVWAFNHTLGLTDDLGPLSEALYVCLFVCVCCVPPGVLVQG